MSKDLSKTEDTKTVPENAPKIEGFELIEECGESNASSLWKARQISLGRTVVIKILSEKLSNDPDVIKQFQLEAKMAASLKHQGIVQIYDFGRASEGGRYYFVMEYITGYTVGDWVRRKQKLTEHDVLVVGHCVSDALGYAWSHAKMIHCDVKPDNIMVDGDGTIKITDFGLARVARSLSSGSEDKDDDIVGTPNYMSPEQADGKKGLDCRADIYSTGATLYHLLTGVMPFANNDVAEILKKQINESLEPPIKLVHSLSPGISEFVMKMLAKNPAHRYQNWQEVAREILRFQTAAKTSDGQDNALDKINRPLLVSELTKQDLMSCPYCARLVRKQVESCPFCSKPMSSKKVVVKPKLKKPEVVSAPRAVPSPKLATPLTPKLPKKNVNKKHQFGENMRLMFSLLLLAFLAYYGYERLVNKRDIVTPVKTALYYNIIPACNNGVDRFKAFIASYFINESESLNKTAHSSRLENKPAAGQDGRDPEFLRILRECENNTPGIKDFVSIKLKEQESPLEGTLERIGISGVILGVDQGTVVCPYVVMEANSRLQFFPEERANVLWKQQLAEQVEDGNSK